MMSKRNRPQKKHRRSEVKLSGRIGHKSEKTQSIPLEPIVTVAMQLAAIPLGNEAEGKRRSGRERDRRPTRSINDPGQSGRQGFDHQGGDVVLSGAFERGIDQALGDWFG